MDNRRILVLAGVALLLCATLVWRWMSGWGLVTVDFTDAPLAKVIRSIERQGGVKIATNADLTTPVTILLNRAPVFEAIDTLAARIDGDARLAFIAAPTKKQITEVLAAFTGGTNPGGWSVFSAGFGGGFGGFGSGESEIDPRRIEWTVSEAADKNLQTLLQQGAQKTGALFATPEAWNPLVNRLPSAGTTGQVAGGLVKAARGHMRELFLITVRPPRPEGERAAGERGPDRWEGRTVLSPGRGNRNANPEWMAERIQAQIAQLPADERAEAQKQFDEMRNFWQSVRALPEEERRAKWEELMNNPEVQARMEERMAARDARRSPQQREQRMRRYVDRKQQAKQAAANP